MKSNRRKFQKNDAAFTGLEAAIVLIAFVVVAAVFSYVMLGAGFFTSQKSKEVVHTGVDQATSSIEMAGDVVGIGASGNLTGLMMTLQITAGNNPVDINKTIISYRTANVYNESVFDGTSWEEGGQVKWIQQTNENNLLEKYEKVQLKINIAEDEQVGPNTKITLEVKPPTGAVLSVSVTTPPAIEPIMSLF
ncbi:archaellin/type IV pilin N-terminal domain-containing protein [Methanocella arvoryzae]|uniref:Flagellin n=1 Tax=Methanocella arvoryzae (strain DSM 22066 / NBRC 105507 / MRE50) TaxID=351160 RepID=Q0W837_METAR|nr:flagellin [Methanocella arvoryzae]CAJ35455.1 putative flagellin precursor [Methanocella arvoryzae MRE50]CAJ35456.1 putative flagellin precursor [Methanocella arvoryzae MRE50]